MLAINSIMFGLPIASSTDATTTSKGFGDMMLHHCMLTWRVCMFVFLRRGPKRLERPKVTAVVDVEIRLSARWRVLPPRHRNASHYPVRRHDAAPDSCRPSRLACRQGQS